MRVEARCARRAGAQTRARYTLEYASPEVIRAVGAMRAHYIECKPSMDIWSLGVIVFEVLTGKAFFPLECNRDAMKDGLIGLEPLPVEEDPKVFNRIPAEGNLRATVKAMLSRDTEKRPTAEQVRACPALCPLAPRAVSLPRSYSRLATIVPCRATGTRRGWDEDGECAGAAVRQGVPQGADRGGAGGPHGRWWQLSNELHRAA